MRPTIVRRAIQSWAAHPQIQILGNLGADRLAIVSFEVRRPGGRRLHHNFVVAVLNDLFGIQARGGCSCAGPYGHRLLDIDLDTSHEFEQEILHGCEGIKPGWTRVNFNYFIGEDAFRYVVEAVHLIADNGYRLLPDYSFDPLTGLWRHRECPPAPAVRLSEITYTDGAMQFPAPELVRSSRLTAGLPGRGTQAARGASRTGVRWRGRVRPGLRGVRAAAVVRAPSRVLAHPLRMTTFGRRASRQLNLQRRLGA